MSCISKWLDPLKEHLGILRNTLVGFLEQRSENSVHHVGFMFKMSEEMLIWLCQTTMY